MVSFLANNYVNLIKFVKTFSDKEFSIRRRNEGSREPIDSIKNSVQDIVNVPNTIKGSY